MVRGSYRSGSKRRVQYRTPSGSKERFEAKKNSKPTSPNGKPLAGVVAGSKSELGKLAKTHKRPNRPYGGQLSSPEMRALIRAQVRLSSE